MRYFIIAISTFALGCTDPPAVEEVACGYYSNGSFQNDTTVMFISTPLAEGTVEIGCTTATLEPVIACPDAPACSKVTLSVLPAIRAQSAPMTIASGDRSTVVTADWSFPTLVFDDDELAEGIEELWLVLMNDTRENSCFVFPHAATVKGVNISVGPGPVLAFEPCGPFR